MIDLAEQLVQNFLRTEKSGTLPYLKLYIGETEEELGKKKYDMFWCRWCFSRIRHRMQRQVCCRSFLNIGYKIKYPCKS
jgi:hypothetical protein